MLSSLNPKFFPLTSTTRLEQILQTKRDLLKDVAKKAGRYYKPFDTYQKRGNKWRHIDNPIDILKDVQKAINQKILREALLALPEEMIGGAIGKSIKDNAQFHINKEMLVTLDLRDCFPNISNKRIHTAWQRILGCGRENARILTQLTSFQHRLPQGASTSLALCNLCLLPLFNEIKKYCKESSIAFSLYVDDITLSGNHEIVLSSINPIVKIVQKHGLAVSNKKIIKMPASVQQKVTGGIVNKKISAEHKLIEKTRKQIIYLAKNPNSRIKTREINKLTGKISSIKLLSPKKGQRLEEFANTLLSNLERVTVSKKRREITRKCLSTRWHIHQRKHLYYD